MSYCQLPSGAYHARLMINGVRYTATLPTCEDAEDWETIIRAKAVSNAPPDQREGLRGAVDVDLRHRPDVHAQLPSRQPRPLHPPDARIPLSGRRHPGQRSHD